LGFWLFDMRGDGARHGVGVFVFAHYRLNVDDAFAFVEANHAYALGVAAALADFGNACANDLAAVCNDHNLIEFAHQTQFHELAVALRCFERDDALTAAILHAPLVEQRTFAKSVFADREHGLIGVAVDDVHADNVIVAFHENAAHAMRVATHRPHVFDVEAN